MPPTSARRPRSPARARLPLDSRDAGSGPRLGGGGRGAPLTLDADEAVWNQPLGFTISGSGCGPQLADPVADSGQVIAVAVADQRPPGFAPALFTLRGELRGFAPGTYTVRASDALGEDTQPVAFFFAASSSLEFDGCGQR